MNQAALVSIIIPTMNRAKEVVACVNSVLGSSYQNMEIIVVDNATTDGTKELIENDFQNEQKIKLISSEINLGAGGGRNAGAKLAQGEYLLFVDSDNAIDQEMVAYLVEFMNNNAECGMVGPLMLHKKNPDVIWLYFADINMYTSQAKYKGTGEKDTKQYAKLIEVGHLPNCFMVRKNDFNKIGTFDEKYLIMYEEADLADKIKKILKKKIYLYSKAITYHDVPMATTKDKEDFGFVSAERAFLTARNRVYFMRKNASLMQFLTFLFIFNPLLLLFYEYRLIQVNKYKQAFHYFKGCLAGFFL